MNWQDKTVLVTGGASFISSHLIDLLAAKGARRIRVVDDLTSGRLENIQDHIDAGLVEMVRADLLNFINQTGADELMITSQIFDHAARLRSFEIAAEALT